MQDFVPKSILTCFEKKKKKKKKKKKEKKRKKKKKKGTRTAFSFHAMANKNRILLTSRNIETPESL